MASPIPTLPLNSDPSSAEKEEFEWFIGDFLKKCWKERQKLGPSEVKVKSVSFSFGGATWNFFLSIDQGEFPCQFKIDIQPHRTVDAEFECCCDIFFLMHKGDIFKNVEYKFKLDNAGSHWTVEDFLSDSELDDFLKNVKDISCEFHVSNSSIKKACAVSKNDFTTFLDSTWSCGGSLSRRTRSSCVMDVHWWFITELHKFEAAMEKLEPSCLKLKSNNFSFGDATFYFFVLFDIEDKEDALFKTKDYSSQFGIHFQTHNSSDEVFDCCINISSKKLKCKFRCESGDSMWTVKDVFVSHSELEEFVHNYSKGIKCRISREKSSIKEAFSRTEVISSSKNGAVEAHAQAQHLENYPMEFPDSTWPRVGLVNSMPSSTGKEEFEWFFGDFLKKYWKERWELGPSEVKVKSVNFSLGGATWNLFLLIDQGKFPCQFGIDIQTHRTVDAEFECCCDIFFLMHKGEIFKNVEYKFKLDNAGSHWTVEDFLSDSELNDFLKCVTDISCKFHLGNSSIKKACSLTGNGSSTFLDSTWPCGGSLSRYHFSALVTDVRWFITELDAWQKFDGAWQELEPNFEKFKSVDFSFGDATFYFFALFNTKDKEEFHIEFGIHFQTHVSSDEVFDCCINISSKKFKCKFRCQSGDSVWTVKDFFSDSEFKKFVWNYSKGIKCRISREKCSIKEACSHSEVSSLSKSGAVKAHTPTPHLENEVQDWNSSEEEDEDQDWNSDEEEDEDHDWNSDEEDNEVQDGNRHVEEDEDQDGNRDEEEDEDPMVKVCQDIKDFFSEAPSDSNESNEVRDYLLKAHRSMLIARNSRHNCKL